MGEDGCVSQGWVEGCRSPSRTVEWWGAIVPGIASERDGYDWLDPTDD